MANGVTTTAMSVAVMALQACQYHTYTEAFQSNPEYGTKIHIEDFMQIVQPVPQMSEDRDVWQQMPPYNLGSYIHQHPTGLQKVPEHITGAPSTEEQVYNLPDCSADSMSRHQYSLPDSTCTNRNIMAEQNSQYGFSTSNRESDGTMQRNTVHNTSLSSGNRDERFPSHMAPVDLKDSLANAFDSTNSMTPLWEDTLCLRGTTQGLPNPAPLCQPQSHKDKSWADHKQLKQFQIRLQNLSGEDTCNSGSEDFSQEECQKTLKDQNPQTIPDQENSSGTNVNSTPAEALELQPEPPSSAKNISSPHRFKNHRKSDNGSSYDAEVIPGY